MSALGTGGDPLTAVGREAWILLGFVALGVAALMVTVAGAILLLRQRRN